LDSAPEPVECMDAWPKLRADVNDSARPSAPPPSAYSVDAVVRRLLAMPGALRNEPARGAAARSPPGTARIMSPPIPATCRA